MNETTMTMMSIATGRTAQMYSAQQYSFNPLGYEPLQAWAAAHTAALHAPPCETVSAINLGSNATLEVRCLFTVHLHVSNSRIISAGTCARDASSSKCTPAACLSA